MSEGIYRLLAGKLARGVNLSYLYMHLRSQSHRIQRKTDMWYLTYVSLILNTHYAIEKHDCPTKSHKSNNRDHNSTYFQEQKLHFGIMKFPIKYQAVQDQRSQLTNIIL